MNDRQVTEAAPDPAAGSAARSTQGAPVGYFRRAGRKLSPSNVSSLYLALALFVLFAIKTPDTFLTTRTLTSTLSAQSVTSLVAIAVVVPMAAGAFDLTVGFTLGISATIATNLMHSGHSTWVAIGAALACGLVIGAVNGLVVTQLRINSFIATLGTGSIIQAVMLIIADKPVFGIYKGFQRIGYESTFGVPWIFMTVSAVALVAWYVLEHTPGGRRLFAAGANADAARMAGLRVNRIVVCSMLASGFLAAGAGLLLAANIGGSSPDLPNSYLLPAFASAFLGATQLKQGRVNVWGTLMAVYALAIGTKGFSLLGVESWVQNLFYGASLIIAVGLSVRQGSSGSKSLLAAVRRRRQAEPA